MAAPSLSGGAIRAIINGQTPTRPILQVLNLKKIQSDSSTQDRYRLQMSDGINYQPCMLATQMNDLIVSEKMDKYSVVELERYICNTIHERKIIIVIQVTVLKSGREIGTPIGKPQPLELPRVDSSAPPKAGGGGGGGGGGNQPPQRSFNGHGNQHSTVTPQPPQSGAYKPGLGGGGGGGGSRGYGGGGGGGGSRTTVMTSPGGTPLSQRAAVPINSLNPYQNKWTIRARVSSKPSLRTWSNSRGDGKVLNVDLVDKDGEIRACAFNDVADKFYALFEMGKVYYISRGRLKPANRNFNSLKNDYELNFTDDTEVEPCLEAAPDLPTLQFDFKAIADLEREEPNSFVDVIGVCRYAADVTSIVTKNNRKVSKRDITLVDRSSRTISLTLWGGDAEEFDGSRSPVVAIKGAKVSDFGGRSLSTQFSSVLSLNPDIPEAHSLRGWYDSTGQHEEASSLSDQRGGGGGVVGNAPYLSFGQVKELDLGRGDKPDYFTSKGAVMFARNQNVLYKACPNQDCNKKVTDGAISGQFFCEKCNQSFPNFKYRMILSINVGDHSGSQWLTCFQDTGSEILGMGGQELGELKEQNEVAYDQMFHQANFKEYTFKIRAKIDTYNDEQRLKCYCVAATPLNYAQETLRRVEEIKQMMGAK